MAANSSIEFKYTYGACYLVAGVIGILLNIKETSCLLRKSVKRRAFDNTVMSLSIADLVSGIFFSLIGLGVILFTSNLSDFRLVQYAVIGLNFSVMASLNHVLLIALQRSFAALIPNRLSQAEKSFYLTIVLVLVWVLAGIYGILSFKVINDFIRVNSYVIIIYSTLSMLMFGPVLCKANQECLTVHGEGHGNVCLCGRRVMVHSILVTLGLFVCFFPFAVNNLMLTHNVIRGAFCDVLVAVNPIIDSMVYFYVNRRKDGKMRLEDANLDLQVAEEGIPL